MHFSILFLCHLAVVFYFFFWFNFAFLFLWLSIEMLIHYSIAIWIIHVRSSSSYNSVIFFSMACLFVWCLSFSSYTHTHTFIEDDDVDGGDHKMCINLCQMIIIVIVEIVVVIIDGENKKQYYLHYLFVVILYLMIWTKTINVILSFLINTNFYHHKQKKLWK